MSNPKISIIIAVYNRSELLEECIQSFIKQTFKDFEIIVVDDGSEEDLTFISHIDSRIKYIRQEHFGISKAFNNAIDNSSGDYICYMGSDDIALQNLLEESINILDNYLDIDIVYSNYYILNKKTNHKKEAIMRCFPKNKKRAYKLMLKKQFVPHPGSVWRAKNILKCDESLESAIDWELFLTALEKGLKFYHINKFLWIYRINHEYSREGETKKQEDCCDKLLKRRGYRFNKKRRCGIKICN